MNKNAVAGEFGANKAILDEVAICLAARKVADAAVVFLYAEFEGGIQGHRQRSEAFADAVREYRALTEPQETVEYVSHRLNSETAGGRGSHCSKCGEAVPGKREVKS